MNEALLFVLFASPPRTATSMMATYRFLYHEGAKLVLQHPAFLDGSEQSALSLLRFIQAEDFSRCSYSRTLHILTDPISESVAKILVDTAPRMSNLECLCLKGEHSLEAYPYLLPAFTSLRSVKRLTMLGAGSQACELVKTLQSELVSAAILFNVIPWFQD